MNVNGQVSSLFSLACVACVVALTVNATNLVWDKVIMPKVNIKK